MRINNLTKCRKPCGFETFKGSFNPNISDGKVRYKHYEELNDEVLRARSIISAHKEIEKSGKMRLFKAIPTLTTALIGTSIAIAQPGKLAAKAGAGLGFLALSQGLDVVSDKAYEYIDKKHAKDNTCDKTKEKILALLGSMAAITALGAAAFAAVKNLKAFEPLKKFLSKEANQLSKEINTSKAGKFFEDKIVPFSQKHTQALNSLKFTAPLGVIAASSFAQLKMADSLSKDMKEKADENFLKGKEIQRLAKEHFDSLDAVEV